jgi:hypothetical protein
MTEDMLQKRLKLLNSRLKFTNVEAIIFTSTMQNNAHNLSKTPQTKKGPPLPRGSPFNKTLSRLRHAFKFFPQQFEAEQGVLFVSVKRDVGVIEGPIVNLFQRAAQILDAMKKHKLDKFNLGLGEFRYVSCIIRSGNRIPIQFHLLTFWSLHVQKS